MSIVTQSVQSYSNHPYLNKAIDALEHTEKWALTAFTISSITAFIFSAAVFSTSLLSREPAFYTLYNILPRFQIWKLSIPYLPFLGRGFSQEQSLKLARAIESSPIVNTSVKPINILMNIHLLALASVASATILKCTLSLCIGRTISWKNWHRPLLSL